MRVAALVLTIVLGMGRSVCAAQASSSGAAVAQAAGVSADAADGAASRDEPQFDVATIKPSDPATCCGKTWGLDGRRFSTNNTNLRWLIRFAYSVNDRQIVGGPAWMDGPIYDITAQYAGAKPPTNHERRIALQKLLTERFGLTFHHESREMPAYVLTVARGGPKLKKSDPKKNTEQQLGFGGDVGGTMYGSGRDVSLHDFIGEIQRLALDRPVVDKTGIAGTYDIELEFTRELPNALGMTELPDNAAPNLLTALNEQLGLKMAVEKTAVDVMVIDHADPPSAN